MSRIRAILGPVHYRPVTSWGPIRALVAMEVAALVAALVAMALLFASFEFFPITTRTGPNSLTITPSLPMLAGVLVFDILVILAAWRLAGRDGMRASEVLALRWPSGGGKVLFAVVCVMAAVIAIETAAAPLWRSAAQDAARLIAALVGESGWPIAILTIGIAAPVAEELWLRGFLLSALAKTRLGFWGAGLLTCAAFAALHALQYALVLLVPVFLLGLVLTWAVGLTGSLWVPIALHMANNLLALLLLWWR
jgi:membrane protease YdiL (CAAX protease family)